VPANPARRGEMGVKLNLKVFFGYRRTGVPPGLKIRVIGTVVWSSAVSSAVLLSQPGKGKAVTGRACSDQKK